MDSPSAHADMSQFFDFSQASGAELSQEPGGSATAAPLQRGVCPAHGDGHRDGCLCHGFQEDFGIPGDLLASKDEPTWNPDFSSWLPRYKKPEHPCDYCRSRSLECFIYDSHSGIARCSPCNALFRECSFSKPSNQQSKSRTELDTLCAVDEGDAHVVGGFTGKKPLRSLGHIGPIEHNDDGAPKKGAAAARFPRAAVKILKDWMADHIDSPYPTEEEKEELKIRTGLTSSQVTNWMANTRRRQKTHTKRAPSPSLRPCTEAIRIPGRVWETMNPLERWKHSPPENEPAPMTAIAKAVQVFDPPEPSSLSSSLNGRKGNSNESSGSFSVFRAPSTTSLETGFTNMSSGSGHSYGTAWSYGSHNSFGSLNSSARKERRRRRRVAPRPPRLDSDPASARLFQCTFCTDRFKSKYDWSRHEKSLHLSLEKWMCAPIGEVVTCSASGQRKCVYCDAINPTQEHLETHNHSACVEKGREARTFYRKDHLRQHLRLMHGCKMIPCMDTWKSEAIYVNSRCGFCGTNFTKWQDRVDHLAKEFRNGADMKNWKGCRGLDAHVAALVTNAMPPYLIANESKSPLPFSATNTGSMQHSLHMRTDLEYLIPSGNQAWPPHTCTAEGTFDSLAQEGYAQSSDQMTSTSHQTSPTTSSLHPNATCWEALTLRLGRYAREHVEKYGRESLTDEMLQLESRRILYDTDDPWNQTAADNPEWLGLFKKAHGLEIHQPGVFKDRHEVLEDLGLNEKWTKNLDPSFDLSSFTFSNTNNDQNVASKGQSGAVPELACADFGNLCPKESVGLGNSIGNMKTARPTNTRYHSSLSDLVSNPSTVAEAPCTVSGNMMAAPLSAQDHFSFPSWDQVPEGFQVPTTMTDGFGHTMPLHNFGGHGGGGDLMQGMGWDDAELGFRMDMDVELDMDLAMNSAMGTSMPY